MSIKSSILEKIKQKRITAINLASDNLERALCDEEFKKNYLKYKDINFKIAKCEFENIDVAKLKTDLEKVKNSCNRALKKINMTFEDFLPKFACKKCNDTGYVGEQLCSCYYQELNKMTSNNIGIKIHSNHIFENCNFDIFENKVDYEKKYKNMQDWCDKFDSTKYKNIVLCGKSGVGKTFLAECICNRLLKHNISINFYSAFALNNLFLKYHTTFDQTKSTLLDGVLTCDLLVIDDLGSEPTLKNVTIEYLYVLLSERLNNNKSTIVTTNLSLDKIIDAYGERVFSRLCNKSNSLLINLQNKDLRISR